MLVWVKWIDSVSKCIEAGDELLSLGLGTDLELNEHLSLWPSQQLSNTSSVTVVCFVHQGNHISYLCQRSSHCACAVLGKWAGWQLLDLARECPVRRVTMQPLRLNLGARWRLEASNPGAFYESINLGIHLLNTQPDQRLCNVEQHERAQGSVHKFAVTIL